MNQSNQGKLISLDVSIKRIGVAVCDPLRLAARPLLVIMRQSRNADFSQLAQLVTREEAEALICGLPLNMDGSEGERAKSIRKWAIKLAHAMRALTGIPIPVIFWDERLSTFGANEVRAQQRNIGVKQIVEEDAAAAALILQSYLDAQHEQNPDDFGRIELQKVE